MLDVARNMLATFAKDRNDEPERGGGSEWEPIKFFSKEIDAPTR
jgi:hypothetical protein